MLVHSLVIIQIIVTLSYLVFPKNLLHKLQMLQNTAAFFITRAPSGENVATLVLQQLPWLPVKYCIDFRILLLSFKTLCFLISNLLHNYTPSRTLRLSSSLSAPPARVAPRLLNAIQQDIHNIDSLQSTDPTLKHTSLNLCILSDSSINDLLLVELIMLHFMACWIIDDFVAYHCIFDFTMNCKVSLSGLKGAYE